ncbi:nuclear transport factor 2 family protein [Nonlabens sp. Ci31]|nr:nuclear transport factor 2 family protein [Nonlabens sp. Ci31]
MSETDEEAITAVEEVVQSLFDEVWAGYDETAITTYQTNDFLLLEHGEVWNNNTIADWCKNAKTKDQKVQRINNFERIEARRNGDKLWLAYHNYGTFKKDTITYKRAWLESVVAVKEDSVWKLELMHSTRQPVE